VSCASAGNCSAAGFYADSSGHEQAFMGNKTLPVPGPSQQPAASNSNHTRLGPLQGGEAAGGSVNLRAVSHFG
jgi:hypothetical protein